LKTIALLLFVSQCLLTPWSSLHAEEPSAFATAAEVEPAVGDHSIKVGEYAAFLRAVAAQESELQALYNTRFQDQIDRIWTGDHFDYQVKAGIEENTPLRGLLQEEVVCYYDWIEHGADSQAAATPDDKKAESSPLMMFKVGEKQFPNEKKSPNEHLSPSERTDQKRRVVESKESGDGEHEEFSHLYQNADQAWEKSNRGWEEQMQSYRALQESQKRLILSYQKLEQARKVTTDEERQKTYLGKIAKYAGILARGLTGAPDPHAQAASVASSVVGGV
jgi:hypothetical protein